MLNRIKKALKVHTNRDLAKKLEVDESLISRWGTRGFHRSTAKLLNALLGKYEE